jgi:hypothetical protein
VVARPGHSGQAEAAARRQGEGGLMLVFDATLMLVIDTKMNA